MKKKIDIIMAVIMLVSVFYVSFFHGSDTRNVQIVSVADSKIIVVDAGHGGVDPGKIGANGAKEKDINLQIAEKVKKKLGEQQVQVVMTREEDKDLAPEGSSNRKRDDMKMRCLLIQNAQPDCVVSIHQNSFSDASAKGAQVFYFEGSEEGKRLGETLQSFLVEYLDKENHRLAKGNTSYYLLKKTEVPLAIAECGFLSNGEEAALLVTEEYQEKVAEAICEGILAYLAEKEAEIL